MADTTKGIVAPAGWTYLYDLVVAQRVTNGQAPLQFPHARRFIMLATAGNVFITRDPKGDPAGVQISVTATAPTIIGGTTNASNESLRNYYIKGGGTLQLDCDN